MISIELSKKIERNFKNIVRESYNGDVESAIISFLKLHRKYAWKEQLLEDVESIRFEVRRQGGITMQEINQTVRKYRRIVDKSNG